MSKLLPEDYIENVLNATSIVDLINQTIPLKKSGPEFMGVCPFHADSAPSMSVSGAKGLYLCRSCGASGNAITFLKENTGITFVQAVEQLARQAGMPSPDEVRGRSPEESGRHRQLLAVMNRAQELYREALRNSPDAQDYLRGRGITPKMADTFGIGYAPSGRKFLEQNMHEFPQSLLMEAGICFQSAFKENKVVDFMESRIIFPIKNSGGQIVAFGGRSLVDGTDRKYLNTPETTLFKKGSELYGMHESTREIHRTKSVIVTEGYTDVVIPHGHGVSNVVSAMGVALQPATIAKLFKSADTIVFCFDGDEAGKSAALRAMQLTAPLINERKRCRFAFMPNGMDPDDFVRSEGAESFRDFIQKSEPMSKYIMREFMSRHEMDTVEGNAGFAADAMELVERMTSPTVKGLMIQLIKKTIGEDIPLPGVTAGVPAIVPLVATAPSRSAFARRSAGPTPEPFKLTTPNRAREDGIAERPQQALTRTESQNVPSMAIKVLGVLLEEPLACDIFEPHWLNCISTIPHHEIDAVQAVVDFVRGRENDDIKPQQILQNFVGTPVEKTLSEAGEDAKTGIQTGPIDRMNGFMNLLATLNNRVEKAKKLGLKL